jgi:dipicolinate synthase subunit A
MMTGQLLEGIVIAVVGGDERESEIARMAAAAGADLRAFGFPWPEAGIVGVVACASAADALEGANYALFPIPGMGHDGSLFAPSAPAPIVPDAALLAHMRPGASIILGTADEPLRRLAAALGLLIVEYESDTELMLTRGPAIVEGAIATAILNTVITLHNADVGVVGHGTIGRLLARKLVAMFAHVHVFARNPVQRAEAYAAGCSAHPLEDLARIAPDLDMLFSTVSAPVVDRGVLVELAKGSLVMDLAAPPGSVDLVAAEELGLRGIWARGLGRRAPVTVGRSQWIGILKRIVELEEKRANGS